MTQIEATNLCKKILKEFDPNNVAKDNTIADLKTLRSHFLAIEDPMLTKTVRLAYEHLANNKSFDIEIEDFEATDEQSTFEYFVELLENYEHPFNRKELQEFKAALEQA
ncbi:MAG: hypothetical protein WCP74_00590 [Sphingobacteriia bacterium]|jgi:hypothetical protein